jgi:hypothetical protein
VRHGGAEWRAFVEFLTECQVRAGLASRIVADTDWLLAGYPVVEFVR